MCLYGGGRGGEHGGCVQPDWRYNIGTKQMLQIAKVGGFILMCDFVMLHALMQILAMFNLSSAEKRILSSQV